MAILTEEMILAKTRCSSIEKVRNLNMYGSDIGDVSILKQMKNLETLSLSANRIASLYDFSGCSKLQELYLRQNHVADLHQVHALRGLKYLHTLWLEENPCTSAKDYRSFVIFMLPRLCKLDNMEISNDEREKAEADFADRPMVPEIPVPITEIHPPFGAKFASKPPQPPVQQGVGVDNRVCESPRIMVVADTPRVSSSAGRCHEFSR
jgi:hypothetical protein